MIRVPIPVRLVPVLLLALAIGRSPLPAAEPVAASGTLAASTSPVGGPGAASAAPWSYDLHELICEIAWQRLSPAGRRFVQEVREDDPEPSSSFASSCIWADEVRRTTHRDTYEYHFINVERGSEDVDWSRDCPFACVSVAVVRYARALAEPAGSRGAREGRAEALKFVAHFVADLHQPLHAGYGYDRGGNDTDVIWNGEEENLHWVWDGLILQRAGVGGRADAEALSREITGAEARRWASFDVYGWTDEAFEITRTFAYDLPDGDLAEAPYADRAAAVELEQLKKAGVRLAFLIDAIAEGRPLEFPPFPAGNGRVSDAPEGAGSLVPVDEAARDPELLTLRARLLRALAEGDLETVMAAADPEIQLSFGGDYGRDAFRDRLREPEYRGDLAAALALGGVFRGDSTFISPYTFARWPDGYEVFGCWAVIGEEVRVRAAPDLDAEILELVSYEPVCYEGSPATPAEGWTEVTLDDGRTGYVSDRFLRSPVTYRAFFEKKDGRWWLTIFVAGD